MPFSTTNKKNSYRQKTYNRAALARRKERVAFMQARRLPGQRINRRAPIYRSIVGFPQKAHFNLKYVDRFTTTSVAAALDSYSVYANAIYAPVSSSHQPMYFDQIMSLYNHWVVVGAKIKVMCSLDNNASTNGGLFTLYLNDDKTVVPTTIEGAAEQSSAKGSQIAAVSNQGVVTLYGTYSAYKVFGNNPTARSELQGDSVSNCGETTAWTMNWQSYSGNAALNVTYEIEYSVDFFELKDIVRS